jgi:hypothetical protein
MADAQTTTGTRDKCCSEPTEDLINDVLFASYQMRVGGRLMRTHTEALMTEERLIFLGYALELIASKLQSAAEELERRDCPYWGKGRI